MNTGACAACARGADTSDMASACTAQDCKRCGTFGHETEGCDAECKRCGGRHGTRKCFRMRSYVVAARGFQSANEISPSSSQINRPPSPNASASASGLQVLKPRTPPSTTMTVPNYWDSEGLGEKEDTSVVSTAPEPQPWYCRAPSTRATQAPKGIRQRVAERSSALPRRQATRAQKLPGGRRAAETSDRRTPGGRRARVTTAGRRQLSPVPRRE